MTEGFLNAVTDMRNVKELFTKNQSDEGGEQGIEQGIEALAAQLKRMGVPEETIGKAVANL